MEPVRATGGSELPSAQFLGWDSLVEFAEVIIIDLFAGIDGLGHGVELALRGSPSRPAATLFFEVDPFCRQVLRARCRQGTVPGCRCAALGNAFAVPMAAQALTQLAVALTGRPADLSVQGPKALDTASDLRALPRYPKGLKSEPRPIKSAYILGRIFWFDLGAFSGPIGSSVIHPKIGPEGPF